MQYWTPSFKHFTELFIGMARMTTPHGNEAFVWANLPNAPFGAPPNCHPNFLKAESSVDEFNNYIVYVPGAEETLWMAHCDTADADPTHVNLLKSLDSNGDLIIKTDGCSILGADDKIGCAMMACMIKAGVPGTYIFFAGEEVGCVGSKKLSAQCEKEGWKFDHAVSFDRRGKTSIITHQLGDRTASDEWAVELAELLSMHGVLGYKPDSGGIYTDSNEFVNVAAECTNIGVGYEHQHCNNEEANMSHAYRLLMAFIKIGHRGLPTPTRKAGEVDPTSVWTYDDRSLWVAGGQYNTDEMDAWHNDNGYMDIDKMRFYNGIDATQDKEAQ